MCKYQCKLALNTLNSSFFVAWRFGCVELFMAARVTVSFLLLLTGIVSFKERSQVDNSTLGQLYFIVDKSEKVYFKLCLLCLCFDATVYYSLHKV